MKTAGTWDFKSLVGKTMVGVVLATMVGSIDVTQAFGKDNRGKHDNGRYEQRGRGVNHNRQVQTRRVYRPYGYQERVYTPPPVVYAPPPPPGISIFFPPIFIHP